MNKKKYAKVKVIDLFCGIGGLTHGLQQEGLGVVAGIDNDGTCRYGYEHNNSAKFIQKDILEVTPDELNEIYGDAPIRVLVGCAPCQPFSKLNLKGATKKQLEPVGKFAQLIELTKPHVVSMENVSGLANTRKYPVFQTFLDTLDRNGYEYDYHVVDVSEYGVPQRRKRLVLLASRLGQIKLIEKTHNDKKVTVRDVIGNLEPIKAGQTSTIDPLHRSRDLSPLNMKRIKATPHNGGNSDNWSDDLVLECHKRESGKTYKGSVYGRMYWDQPSPTITTQCAGIGNGRFGHPEQDRAISLREAARIQTFPDYYKFSDPSGGLYFSKIAKFIGNAVPVKLGTVIAKSIKIHLDKYEQRQEAIQNRDRHADFGTARA